MVAFAILHDPDFAEINCDPNAYPAQDSRRGWYLLDTQEQAIVRERVEDFNNFIRFTAEANGWSFVDPAPVYGYLLEMTDANARYPAIRKCQALPAAGTPSQMQTALLSSCPVSGQTAASSFFGSAFSLDGVHPSGALQIQLAGAIALQVQ
jgi:hypothetical protein